MLWMVNPWCEMLQNEVSTGNCSTEHVFYKSILMLFPIQS